MKVKNFPGRKYLRRVKALQRIQAFGNESEHQEKEKKILRERTNMTQAQAEAIRTKKDRSGRVS